MNDEPDRDAMHPVQFTLHQRMCSYRKGGFR